MTSQLAGRTALITGAGRGIGRAVALGLAEAGVRLILIARSADQLAETAAAATAAGAPASLTIQADLADDRERDKAVTTALDHGPVDIMINNAAVVEPLGPTAHIDVADVRRAFELNVVAAIALDAAVAPGMTAAGWGRIVNVSSGIVASPGTMVGGNIYAATKAALEAHTLNLAAEVAGTGVTANVYRPGGVDTAMQAWIRDQDPDRIGTSLHERFTRSHANGTLLTPQRSAASLIARIGGDTNGQICDVNDDIP